MSWAYDPSFTLVNLSLGNPVPFSRASDIKFKQFYRIHIRALTCPQKLDGDWVEGFRGFNNRILPFGEPARRQIADGDNPGTPNPSGLKEGGRSSALH